VIPRPRPDDDTGVPGTVYVLHSGSPCLHAAHYVGWTAGSLEARLAAHLHGMRSALVRAAVAAGADIALVATFAGTRALERRLKRCHETAQFCPWRRDMPQAAGAG